MQSYNNWLIRSEFAPHWMRSQGIDPILALLELTRHYIVVEALARVPYFASLEQILCAHVKTDVKSCQNFVNYVESLNLNGRGWVDIYIFPKEPSWM